MLKNRNIPFIYCVIGATIFLACAFGSAGRKTKVATKPTLFIIGDSTVKNGKGDGAGGLWGWGDCIASCFDTAKVGIRNHAIGGRSSRTFQTEGRWNNVLSELKPGDFVMMQFGHNDGSPLNTGRARGTLKGIGDETEEVIMEATGQKELVHTYGWYMKKYIANAKTKGAIPIVLSPVPRNQWTDDKVNRAEADYAKWAREAAEAEGAFFIDLNEIVAKCYESEGSQKVQDQYFTTKDHTHTSWEGAKLNAESVIEGLRALGNCPLVKFVLPASNESKAK